MRNEIMFKAVAIVCGLFLAGCAAQSGSTPPPMSPMDECRQAQQSGDTTTIAQKCAAIMRDQ
jgi:hypothetical protein